MTPDQSAAAAFDRITRLATRLIPAPIAAVVLVNARGQVLRSVAGFEGSWTRDCELPYSEALCRAVASSGRPVALADARLDPVARDAVAVRDMGIVAYLGVPLHRADGTAVGSLCVADREPRIWTEEEVAALQELGAVASGELIGRGRELELEIAERKRALEALTLLESAIEQTQDAVTITTAGPDYAIVYVNAAFTKLTGYQADEVLGRNPRFLQGPRTEPAVLDRLRDALATGAPFVGETYNYRKDGTEFRLQWEIVPVRNAAETITHFAAVQRDVTASRALEAQLRMAQRMEAVGQLAGGVAHDFNNLLTALLSHAELALAELEAEHPAIDDVEQIRRNGLRAAALTRQLLAFSRQQTLQPKVVSLNDVVQGVEPMLRRLIGEHIGLTVTADPGLGATIADPGQLEQVIMNLVVNARDAMPDGGQLEIRTAAVEVVRPDPASQPGLTPGHYVTLHVSDTGVGMDEATRARVFEPFFTTKEPGHGTGLGLSTVFGIVKQSNGFIYVASAPGVGTTFMVFLPRVTAVPPARETEATPAAPSPNGSETILLVEDEDSVRRAIGRVLRRQGYHVLEAINGADALRLCRESERAPDLVLTDVVMPEIGGRALVETLQAEVPSTRILVMSGYPERDRTAAGPLPASVAFVAKPFTLDSLLRAVREALAGNPR